MYCVHTRHIGTIVITVIISNVARSFRHLIRCFVNWFGGFKVNFKISYYQFCVQHQQSGHFTISLGVGVMGERDEGGAADSALRLLVLRPTSAKGLASISQTSVIPLMLLGYCIFFIKFCDMILWLSLIRYFVVERAGAMMTFSQGPNLHAPFSSRSKLTYNFCQFSLCHWFRILMLLPKSFHGVQSR